MDDRHKISRTHVSGALKRKLKVERNKQVKEFSSQIPKPTNYFSPLR